MDLAEEISRLREEETRIRKIRQEKEEKLRRQYYLEFSSKYQKPLEFQEPIENI